MTDTDFPADAVPEVPVPETGLLLEHCRYVRTDGYVEGALFLGGALWCHLLEDTWRDLAGVRGNPEAKVPGHTCIPAGTYRVTVTWSPRFGKRTAEILDIPGFTGVRYHSGSNPEHTKGCPLLGRARAGAGRLIPDPSLTDKLAEILQSRKGTHYVRITDDFLAE